MSTRKVEAVTTLIYRFISPFKNADDIAFLIGRTLLGVVLMAHGFEKYFQWGLGDTTERFVRYGVPMPSLSAFYAATVELLGGALLILGAATTVISALVVVDMIGASVFSRAVFNGIRLLPNQQGWELNGTILAIAAALLVCGSGRYSIDHLLLSRRPVKTAAPRSG